MCKTYLTLFFLLAFLFYPTIQDNAATNENSAKPSKVYVTSTGKSYHYYKDCSGLSQAKSIKEISISEVGSRHLCSKCASRYNGKSEFVSAPKQANLGSASIVYILESKTSKAYHASKNCKALLQSDKTPKAVTKSQAESTGKHACKYCVEGEPYPW